MRKVFFCISSMWTLFIYLSFLFFLGNHLEISSILLFTRILFLWLVLFFEHGTYVSNTADIPSRDIPIKRCLTEHVTHVSNTADIPSRDIPIKGGYFKEHVCHISNTAHISSRDIPIKGCSCEHPTHVSNAADIPSRDIPIKGG